MVIPVSLADIYLQVVNCNIRVPRDGATVILEPDGVELIFYPRTKIKGDRTSKVEKTLRRIRVPQ